MSYRYQLSKTAERYVSRVEPERARQIRRRLDALCIDPVDATISKPLHGPLQGRRSSDLGNLRILYRVGETLQVLDVIDIAPRGDIYKR